MKGWGISQRFVSTARSVRFPSTPSNLRDTPLWLARRSLQAFRHITIPTKSPKFFPSIRLRTSGSDRFAISVFFNRLHTLEAKTPGVAYTHIAPGCRPQCGSAHSCAKEQGKSELLTPFFSVTHFHSFSFFVTRKSISLLAVSLTQSTLGRPLHPEFFRGGGARYSRPFQNGTDTALLP